VKSEECCFLGCDAMESGRSERFEGTRCLHFEGYTVSQAIALSCISSHT
jgi:hypothetical protein